MKGIRFNGIHNTSFTGLCFITSRRPLLPETKDTYIDVPGRSGSILIPDKSFRDVYVEVDFTLNASSSSQLISTAQEIANWLITDKRAPLIFDDYPGYYYNAKAESGVTLEQLLDFEEIAEFTVAFRCEPIMKVVGS